MTITLIRNHNSPSFRKGSGVGSNAVRGTIELPFDELKPLVYPTLENADYLIPEGTYPLRSTWSPRFKKFMPEICDVPEREGIRIHMGTIPEHSTGCVLVSYEALVNIQAFINHVERNYDEEVFISVSSA